MTRSLREVAPPWASLAFVGAVGWTVFVLQARTMGPGPGTMGMAVPLFLGMWVAMMAAMMLPAVGRSVGEMFAADGGGVAGRIAGALTFAGGFLVPWAIFGVVAFAAFEANGRLVESRPDIARWLGVAVFATVGLYQFSPWKLSALHRCRSLLACAGGGGRAQRLAAGLRHGWVCVGCCWALMTVLVAVGVMNVAAMAGLAAVIFAEKVLPRPRLIAGLAGAVFLAIALLVAVDPSLLSGLQTPQMGMEMGAPVEMDMGGM